LKWTIELSQFDVTYHPRVLIKGQAFADFVVEFMGVDDKTSNIPDSTNLQWGLFVDGASNEKESSIGIVLVTPEGQTYVTQ